MGIVYFLATIILIASFTLIKKSENKVNIVESVSFNIVLLFCYNTFVCYILTFFAILNKLWILSLINIIISVFLILIIVKKREVQKFAFDKVDLIFITILLLFILGISYINFGFPFNVNYETSDPAEHYINSIEFAEKEILMPGIKEKDYIYGNYTNRKNASYLNSGILMKAFNNTNFLEYFNTFAYFGMFTLFLTGIITYYLFKKFTKNIWEKVLSMIVSFVFILGYPLNSFLFGFEYLSMGILIICSIINYIENLGEHNCIYIKVVLFLLNFGLFNAYFMFIPIIYPAEWIYFYIKNYKKTKRIITKELAVFLIIILLIPFILGFIYYMEPNLYTIIINRGLKSQGEVNFVTLYAGKGFAFNGYIYINKYSNFIFLIPLTIYYFIKEKKEQKLFDELLLLSCLLWMLLLYIGYFNEKVSIYYLSKNYFVLWIILIYYNFKALIKIRDKNSYLPNLLVLMYIILIIIELFFSRVKMNGNETENKYENIFEVAQIFAANKNILEKQEIELNRKEMEILKYAKDNLDLNSHIEVVSDPKQYVWNYVFIRHIKEDDEIKYTGKHGLVQKVAIRLEKDLDNAEYIIYFKRSGSFRYFENRIFSNEYRIIFENEAGGIVKRGQP